MKSIYVTQPTLPPLEEFIPYLERIWDNKILTNGGRVIALTSTGSNMKEAIAKSMQAADLIQYTNKYYRKDIAQDLIQYHEHI